MLRILPLLAFASCILLYAEAGNAQAGCTDPLASNYNASATHNDGNCTYAPTVIYPVKKGQLSDSLRETSGLLYWNGMFWTHNDDGDTALYALDTLDGHILRRIPITGVINHDWEEITQDADYLYIGDFGNNGSGNRQDLTILKISKADLSGSGPVSAQQILFRYADQTDFSNAGSNNTDFDCEAFIAAGDSLYLFTKQWVSRKTKIYPLTKSPGPAIHSIRAKDEYNISGLVTGAYYLAEKRTAVLCGYSTAVAPFVCLLYDFSANNFFGGNKRKLIFSTGFLQVEGIASIDGRRFFVSNEMFPAISNANLHTLDLSVFLSRWYQTVGISGLSRYAEILTFYPNPATNKLYTSLFAKKPGRLGVSVYDSGGRHLKDYQFSVKKGNNIIELTPESDWVTGQYYFDLQWDEQMSRGRVEFRK